MRNLALGLAFAVIGATAASAQTIQFGGPGGPGVSVNRGERSERTIIERRDRGFRDEDRVVVRRRGGDCRTIIVKKENRFGDIVTKRIRKCD